MNLFWLETKKILKTPAIIMSVIICAVFNLSLFFAYGISPLEIAEPENVFEGYSTEYIAQAYISGFGLGGSIADNMSEKYIALQSVVEQKAQDGDSFGQYTYWQHRDIFGAMMQYLLIESVIIAALIMLLILGHEHINHTDLTVYSSKTGRTITQYKLAAALTATLGAFVVLTLVTTLPMFIVYPDLWSHNISSAFNYLSDYYTGVRPFATWHSFTVMEYLQAVVAVSTGIVLCFSLSAYIIGTSIRNSYIGFVVIVLITMCCLFVAVMLPHNNYIVFLLTYTPIWLTLQLPMWFTDGGMNYLWRNFETWGTVVSLGILSAISVLSSYRFKRRDIL